MKKLLLIPLGALCIGLLPAAASAYSAAEPQQNDIYIHEYEVDPAAFYVRFGSPYYNGYHRYYYGYHPYYHNRYYYHNGYHYWHRW